MSTSKRSTQMHCTVESQGKKTAYRQESEYQNQVTMCFTG